jgi:Tol biopolymer transport system component
MKILNCVIVFCLFMSLVVLTIDCNRETCTGPGNDDGQPGSPVEVDGLPKWCPADSTKIGYTHVAKSWPELLEFGLESIWIVDLTCGECQHITEGVLCDWSPDGTMIVFNRGEGTMLLRDLNSGVESALPVRGGDMDFSPCGRKIAFWAEDSIGDLGIYVVDLDGLTSKHMAPGFECDWSPDGEKILRDSLIIVREDGTRIGKVPYNSETGFPAHARWAPGGTMIAYGGGCRNNPRGAGLWLINENGTDQRMIVCPGALPSWSPDGGKLAYTALSGDGRVSAIWIVNTDGTGKRQVTFP